MLEELPGSLKPDSVPPPSSRGEFLSRLFLNQSGLRAGWRLLAYALFAAALDLAGQLLLSDLLLYPPGRIWPGRLLAQELFRFAVAFGAALIMARIEHRPPGVYGLPARSAFGKTFWQGCLIGLVEVSVLIGLVACCGGYTFGAVELDGKQFLGWAALWAFFFLVVGLYEEFQFRGYTQFTLADGIGFWPSAALLSVGFGSVHLFNPGEKPAGVAAVILFGLVSAFTLRRTGNLWLAVGWHASFDFGETFLYSVPNSGFVFPGHLSSASLHGPAWITGGSVGPEGSVFSFLTLGALFLVIDRLYPARPAGAEPR